MEQTDLSIIIVTYNNEASIRSCLNSLPWETVNFNACLIDNRSTDTTISIIEEFGRKLSKDRLVLISNNRNIGYAGGINQGLELCTGEFIMLLGPDTAALPGSFAKLLLFMQSNRKAGIAAPQLINKNGEVQPSCRRFPTYKDLIIELSGLPRLFPKKFRPAWKMWDFDHRTRAEVDQPEASCLIVRRAAFKDVGFMDEQFPIFFNDVDWCRRYKKNGWKIFFFPEARIEHLRGGSILSNRVPMIWKSHQGFYRYFRKYSDKQQQKPVMLILMFILMYLVF